MPAEPSGHGTCSREEVRSWIAGRIEAVLGGPIQGYRATTAMVVAVLLHAATECTSLHAACQALDVADDTTLRDQINRLLTPADLATVVKRTNEQLAVDLPQRMRCVRQELAIDYHDMAYYGRHETLDPWICRGAARVGTTRFLRLATVYVLGKHGRITLAITPVRPGESHSTVLNRLLHRVRMIGVRVERLWLDRGFATAAVVACLKELRLTAVIAWPIRGKDGGTRALCRGRRTHWATHLVQPANGPVIPVQMAVVRAFTFRRDRGSTARWFLYAVIGRTLDPQTVHRLYRHRFAIESSYRALGRVRARTTSRNIALRLLLIAVGFLLLNAWAVFAPLPAKPKRGPRPKPFRLFAFLRLIRSGIETAFGLRPALIPPLLPRQSGNY